MEKKNNLIKWTPLSPVEIYERHLAMWNWSNKVEKIYLGLTLDYGKDQIKNLLLKLLRKTSAVEALKIMGGISYDLHLPNLIEFCTQEKFSGLLGVNQVVNMTLSGLYFHTHVEENFSTILGGISLDYDRRVKLGLMLSEHDEIQQKLDEASLEDKVEFKKIIERISIRNSSKTYPLDEFLVCGLAIKNMLSVSNPIELGLCWAKIDYKNHILKNFDFYSISKGKQDGGFFQYLCIVLLSLKF